MNRYYLQWDKKEDIEKAVKALLKGEALLGTSDTVLGLFTNSTLEGFLTLNNLKGRYEKPYLVLIRSLEKAHLFVDKKVLFQIENILSYCWPGPLTVVVPAKKNVPSYMKSAQETIALRVPHHKGLQELLAHVPAIFSTSANRAGGIIPDSLEVVDKELLNNVSYYISDDCVMSGVTPSTIIEWKHGGVRLIREGAYKVAELEKILDKPLIKS